MDYSTTTLFYDGQFWVLISETHSNYGIFVGRHVFGVEPSNPELLEFVLKGWLELSKVEGSTQSKLPAALSYKLRQRKNRTEQASGRASSRARDLHKKAIAADQSKRQQTYRVNREENEDLKRAKLVKKRKLKKRGH